MRDVAEHAGVSTASVSNFLNNPGRLTEATRTRIDKSIQELGWVPNSAARQLRVGTNSTVGYVTFELTNAHSVEIANGIERTLAAHGMYLLIANDNGSSERECDYLKMFEMQRVRGLIVGPIGDIDEQLEQMRRRGTPSVLSGRQSSNPNQPYVSIDDVLGGELAVRHLLETGKRRIAFIGSSLDLRQVGDRMRGALRAVQTVPGASLQFISAAERTVQNGRQAASELLSRPKDTWPDGIFCANDLLAIGVLQHIALDSSVRVPHDIAVVGYDDIEFAASNLIPLTSIRIPHEQLGKAVADILLNELADTPIADGVRQIETQPELIVRESSRA
ncbi:LacI family DNA-binding transcriptional regulator [Leifsonia sp. AG29]|uniref:LacI family DNA-binding transcriptional regulator n=1 Tax=Leifsonia sp. AG29 TaxID=2598860 RepID=UPI00131B6E43|nr:LacI family DNA-binding transcriptional regulator [Leifsonia sp. AG29]